MSKKKNTVSRRVRRTRGLIADTVGKVPAIGPVLKPILSPVEDFIVKINQQHGKSGRMGAAIATNSTSFYKTWSSGSEMHVVGRDLVRPVPQNLVSRGNIGDLFSVIPANPAYWTGTRIAQLAPGYMQYRPLDFIWEYIPQVAVTQSGTVTIGTLWDTSVSDQDLQQTLVTSNGGCITQCYNAAVRSVQLGANLQYNLFQQTGFLGAMTNPFTFIAAAQGTNGITPGYFMITYHYVFKNPIGASWDFATDWNTTLGTTYRYDYVSAIPLREDENINPAEILHFKDGVWLYEDDTPVPIQNYQAVPVALFACTPSQTVRTIDSTPGNPWPQVKQPTILTFATAETSAGPMIAMPMSPWSYTRWVSGEVQLPEIISGRAVVYIAIVTVSDGKYFGLQWTTYASSVGAIEFINAEQVDEVYYLIRVQQVATTNDQVFVSKLTAYPGGEVRYDTGSYTFRGAVSNMKLDLSTAIEVLPLWAPIPDSDVMQTQVSRLVKRMQTLARGLSLAQQPR